MFQKYFHQLITAISFGVTSGVITVLGMIVGLHAATSSRLAVVAGIIVMAIADGLADAAGMHLSEEAEIEAGEIKHTPQEVWLTTFFTFFSVFGFVSIFAIPLLIFPLKIAVWMAVGGGMLLLVILNFYIARLKKEKPLKLIFGHVLLAIFVVVVSYFVGAFLRTILGGVIA